MGSNTNYIASLYDSQVDNDGLIINEIYSIWAEVYGDHFDPVNKYRWFYKENPAGEGELFTLYREDKDSPVGVQGLSFRSWCYQDTITRVNIFVDLAVKKSHRTLGPASKLVNKAVGVTEINDECSYAFPNQKSSALFLRAGFKRIGTMVRYVKVLNYKNYFDRLLPGVISSLISKPLTFYYSLIDNVRIFAIRNQYCVNVQDKFSENFNLLWEEVRKMPIAISIRDAKYLNWYFGGKKSASYKVAAISDKNDDKLIGYFIYYLDKKDSVVVCDFLARDFNHSMRDSLLMFIRELRKKNITAIGLEYYGNESVVSQLEKIGFKKRESSDILYRASKNNVIQQKDIQYMTHFDRDQ